MGTSEVARPFTPALNPVVPKSEATTALLGHGPSLATTRDGETVVVVTAVEDVAAIVVEACFPALEQPTMRKTNAATNDHTENGFRRTVLSMTLAAPRRFPERTFHAPSPVA
jgi:hypothetical protein